ncbi:histidine--tRNA ligase [Anaerobaca lacustris]|uniref:Histidine--tRNA ligase n=1 Tax=Anaerobaca lacustris TaxID=3044600 RepID=A0AAW6U1U1_9BACT|nr:histidine--tRNA ligase [Sedimentisphaerales bacterium M17dextr]
MKIPPVKGTRDFYPPEMARRNWIIDGWKSVSIRNGFEEYDGPIFEYLKMYQVKSGDEIVEQLFSLQDRGGRDLAIRPEITPTLARMVNQQINALPRPIKWFSVPRLCRAERPQKGRLREFFQWNIDIIGIDSPEADAEVIFTSLDYLRRVGLTAADVRAKISSRRLLASVLRGLGIDEGGLDAMYALLDKKAKLPADTFDALLAEQVPDKGQAARISDFMALDSIDEIQRVVALDDEIRAAIEQMQNVFATLELMGVADYCVFDPTIVRGLAYYTGVVFEIHDIVGELRAICGGGRYDNLLRDFGGPAIPATGMGMGDCVLEILLHQKGLLDSQVPPRRLEFFVACADGALAKAMYAVAARLRACGRSANFSYKLGGLSKQLKEASAQNAGRCIIIGQEYLDKQELIVKDMASGEQTQIHVDRFLSELGTT